MQTFHSFLESEEFSDLSNLLDDFEEFGLKARDWDEEQVRTCLESLDWDGAVEVEVGDFFVDFFDEGYRKTSLSGDKVNLKPKIMGELRVTLNEKILMESLAEKLNKLPKTNQFKGLANLESILKGFKKVIWESIWFGFMEEVNEHFTSWVDVEYRAKVEQNERVPITIETNVKWNGSKPIRMKEWKPVTRVMDEIDFS